MVFSVGDAPVAADDMGEMARGNVVVPAAFRILVDIETVKRVVLGLPGNGAFGLVGAVDWVAVECETNDRGMALPVVRPRGFVADGVLVVVVEVAWGRMAATAVEPPNSIFVLDVVERVEEHDAVVGNADRPHWECVVVVVLVLHRQPAWVFLGFEGDVDFQALFPYVVGVAIEPTGSVGKDGGRMVGQAFAMDNEMFLCHFDDNIVRHRLVLADDFAVGINVAFAEPGMHVALEGGDEAIGAVEQLARIGMGELFGNDSGTAVRVEVPTSPEWNQISRDNEFSSGRRIGLEDPWVLCA